MVHRIRPDKKGRAPVWALALLFTLILGLCLSPARAQFQSTPNVSTPDPFIYFELPSSSATLDIALNHEGDTLVFGAADGAAGGAHVYIRIQDGNWVHDQELLGTGALGNANQGCAVDIDAVGRTVVVGGAGDNGGQGAAWLFARDANTNLWVQQAKLVGSNNTGSSQMGSAVALSADGNTVVIGGPLDNGGVGAIWVFVRTSPFTWAQQNAKLLVPTTLQLRVGSSLGISGDGNTILVGCPTFSSNTPNGTARIFERSGSNWTVTEVLDFGPFFLLSSSERVALSADGRTAVTASTSGDAFMTFTRGTTGPFSRVGTLETFTGLETIVLSAAGDKVILGAKLVNNNENILLETFGQDGPFFTNDRILATSTIYRPVGNNANTALTFMSPLGYALSGNGQVTAIIALSSRDNVPGGVVAVFSTETPVRKPDFYSQMLTAVIGSFFAFMAPTIFVLWCVRPIIEFITKVRKPTPIIYGSEIKQRRRLRAYLNRNGDPDAIPQYQRPYLYLLVPIKVQILAYMFITWVVLFVCLMTVYANSNTCVQGKDVLEAPIYICANPSGGVNPTYVVPTSQDRSFSDHINVMPLAAVTMGFAVPFYVPVFLFLVYSTIWAIGRGPKNKAGAVGGDRLTLLHFAAIHKNVKAVEALIQHGADLHSRDANGRTPLDLAKSVSAPMEIIKLLTEDGVSIEETDVFCSHAWGRDGSTHKVVVRIAEFLQSKGIRVWIDKERLKGDIVRQMTGGIDKTKIVLVFVSQDYIEKVGGPVETDNCKLEFQYAARKKMDAGGVMPILLDPKLKSTADWTGPVGFYLGKSLYVDMTLLSSSLTDTGFNAEGQKKLEEFESKIREALKSYVKHNPAPMVAKNPGFFKGKDHLAPYNGHDVEAKEAAAGHFGQVAPSRPAPNSEQEIRAWANEVGLGDVLAESIIRAGFTDRISLKALFDLTPKDLKATLELPDLVAATKLKSALGKLSYD